MDTVVVEVPAATTGRSGGSPAGFVSGVSWGAVLGGAFVIGAIELILLALGAGFGLSSVSPWPSAGVTLTTFTVMTAIWFIVVQWISAGFGGYVAGRLRTRWTGLHTDEVYFRDTAQGVLAWAVAVVATAAFLAGAATMLTGGATAGATAGASQGAAQSNATGGGANAYYVDTLFRSDRTDAGAGAPDPRPEATRILTRAVAPGAEISTADRTYLAHLVALRTGVSQDEAQKRVDDTINSARQAADAARKAAAQFSLFTAFALLVGAFIAGVAGKIGGHHRDDLPAL
ncbi:MAG: hypothetical protein JO032_02955 [Alphaproteobacteria bacterium]|nr:hypothetical protein [Alphaproteobacteria bacterium]MBV9551732.1 hypothetical protein [Alphaproteobacteria bacterium]